MALHQVARSCTTQLLHAMDYWTSSLDNNIPVDILYLSFHKAFDTVPHCRLFTKLAAYGILGLDKIIPDKSTTEGCTEWCLFQVVEDI